MSHSFNSEEQAKLNQLINEGITVMAEVEALNGGLTDTVKAVAEELNVKPGIIKKAIRIAYKSGFTQEQEDYDTLETILTTVGKTL